MSTHGPVTIGEGCIVSERAMVGVTSRAENTDGGHGPCHTNLARDVVLEPTAVVEAGASIGAGGMLEVGSRIGARAVLGTVCL